MNKKVFALCALSFILAMTSACKRHTADSSRLPSTEKALYHCAMHPQIVSDTPGECPICHMKLTAFEVSPRAAVSNASEVPGHAAVRMSLAIEQRIGVRTAQAQVRELVQPVRAAARVAYDPQLYSAALEHREARKFLAHVRHGNDSQTLEEAQATVDASALRLRQMGLSDEQIDEISQPESDVSGLLVGSRAGRLWIYADVPDNQMSLIRSGQAVELTSPALAGKTFKGMVRSIDPVVNSETRTVRVRISAENSGGELKPGVYVSALIHALVGKALAVPENAVVDTGARQLVYVQTQPGMYEPRVVRVGRQAEGYIEIVAGLKPGDVVASSANFLIDSESRIEAAVQGVRE